MAVSENDLVVGPLTPAAGVKTISLDFYFENASWLEVYKTGSETQLAIGLDYTVSGAGSVGGVVTLTEAANGTDSYAIYYVVPAERSSDMQLRGEFKSGPFNIEMDRIWQRLQYHWTMINRAFRVGSTESAPGAIPNTASRLLGFDAFGAFTTYTLDPVFAAADYVVYSDRGTLLASTEPARGDGAIWQGGTFFFTEVSADEHFTTAGGVKLRIALENPIYAEQWGVVADGSTDNSAALIAMRDALVADDKHKHRHIILPKGTVDYENNRWTENILSLTLEGYGTAIRCTNANANSGDGFVLGPREQMFRQNGDFLVGTWGFNFDLGYRFDGASVGDASITLTSSGDGANFSAGDRIFLHGGATGVGGYTPNTNSWEWHTIASVSGDVLTLEKTIENKFNTDWPDFLYAAADTVNGVSIPEQRLGLPRAVLLDNKPQSDGTTYSYRKYLHYKGVEFAPNPVSAGSDRLPTGAEIMKCTDTFANGVAVDPRESHIVTLKNCVHTDGIELDKLVRTIEAEGCDFGFNANSSAGMVGGTTCKSITFRNCVFGGSFNGRPLENLIIENCEGSARARADSSANGAFMPGFTGKGNGKCYMRGLVGNHLPNQRILAGNLIRQSNFTPGTDVDATDGTATEVFDESNTPTTFLNFTPGKLIWLTSEPRVVGVLDDVFLDGTDIKWRFKSGNMGPSIKSGHITSPLNYSLIGFEVLEIEGINYADRSRFYDVDTGLLDWAKFQSDSVGYDINGTELAGDGTGTTGDSGTKFEEILPNVNGTYRLTYDIATTSGSIVIRDGYAVTNIVTLNGTGTDQTVDFSPISGVSVEFRPNGFDGTFTPTKLERIG